MSAAIGIICKAPQPGHSKTRLATAIGAVAASELSACFLRDVAASIEAVPETLGRRGFGVYAPAGAEHIIRIDRLVAGSPGNLQFIYLTEPGEYTLTARLRVIVDGRVVTVIGTPLRVKANGER